MKTSLDCIPCLLHQSLDAARKLKLAEDMAESLLRKTLTLLNQLDWHLPPPAIARETQRAIRAMTGSDDPYLEQKIADTKKALQLLPELDAAVADSASPFLTAVEFSIAGNAIDLGAKSGVVVDVREVFQNALNRPVDETAVSRVEDAILKSKNVLFLTDNAGEIVFDRPLLEQIGSKKVTVAVRGAPVINDATMGDAERSGLTERFTVVSNGSDAPGTCLSECSKEFLTLFGNADLIISKGQGNYECLSAENGNIVFLFLVKCPLVSHQIGLPQNTYAILFNSV